MSTASSHEALWFLSRGAGTVALVLSSAVMVLGILTRGGRPLPGFPRFAVAGLHRNLALMTLAVLGVHITTAIIDPYVSIAWFDAIVPFASSYHPLTVGLGALTLDLMMAVVISALLRVRLGQKQFRIIHWAAYAIWPIAVIHGFAMGPDITGGVLLGITGVAVASVALAGAWRAATVLKIRPAPALSV
jgi:sulfoxide reductase heme-binding subunit YedZ